MENISSIPKMKVADLKKHLKIKGLPISGNKTELVERLQKALQGVDETLDSSGVPEDEEFDEEEILGGDDVDVDDDENSKISLQEEEQVLSGSIRIKSDSVLQQSEKKKITLNRSEPTLSSDTTSSTKEETPTPSSQTSNKTEDSGVGNENGEQNESEPKRKIIRLSIDSPEEKTKDEVKKDAKLTEEEKMQARKARFGAVDNRPAKLSMETGGTDLGKLKKRAERFGEITSKSLDKVDSLEKKKAREERFGTTTSTTATSTTTSTATTESSKIKLGTENQTDDAKASRAARFGLNGSTENTSEAELKQKRAARFSAK